MKKSTGKKKVVAISGGFDPLHFGHIRLINAARKLGDSLVVILNNDNWLRAKKGFVFMYEKERKEVLESLSAVDRVIITNHQAEDRDRSVSKVLEELKPDIFANGGDRKSVKDIPEAQVCKRHKIKMVFGVGKGGKVQSSSWFTGKMVGKPITDRRPWGHEKVLLVDPNYWTKSLTLAPGHRFSLQRHQHRSEVWVCVEGTLVAEINGKKRTLKVGDVVVARQGQKHRLGSKTGGTVVEVACGDRVVEDDFERLADDYGRS